MKWTVAVVLACVAAGAAGCSAEPIQQARSNANVASAVASLRAIASAQFTYSATCAGGLFAPTLKALGATPTDGKEAFIGADLTSDPSVKSGYTITLVAGPAVADASSTCNGLAAGLAVRDFFVSAAPTQSGAGPYLALVSTGNVYRSPEPIQPVFGAAPPAPAVPVQ